MGPHSSDPPPKKKTGASPSDGLMSYSGNSLSTSTASLPRGKNLLSYPSAEMPMIYSTAAAAWANNRAYCSQEEHENFRKNIGFLQWEN